MRNIVQMQSIIKKGQNLLFSRKFWVVTAGMASIATGIRLYYKGEVCRVDRNLKGETIVVTGGSAGIGRQTVKVLSKKGCKIIFGARDRLKSEKIVEQVLESNKDCKIFFFPLDLADKKSIEHFHAELKGVCDRIDILINNAGVTYPSRRVTKDGFEMTMGVNHLGHFYLTYLLWDLIKLAEKPRIINVSSLLAHQQHKQMKGDLIIDFDDIYFQKIAYNRALAYSRSKLANILFAKELQTRMDRAKINGWALALHPGMIATDLTRELGLTFHIMKALLWPVFKLRSKTPTQGAQTTLYLALQNEKNLQKGGYYGECKLSDRGCPASKNGEYAQRLWKVSQDLLGIKFDL